MLPPKTPLSQSYYRILRWLWRKGPIQAQHLFRELDLSQTLGAKLISQMLEEGVVGLESSSENLAIRSDYGTVLGVHVGTLTISAVLVDFTGELLVSQEFPWKETSHLSGPAALIPTIQDTMVAMEPLLRPPDIPPLRGVAVSLPGVVDPYRLILLRSNPLRVFDPLPLKDVLGRSLGRPLSAENDANCCCWGEAVLHRRRPLGNFLCLLAEQRPYTVEEAVVPGLSFGVGAGLYLNGSVYHGSRFSAGEFQSILKNDPDHRNQFSVSDESIAERWGDPVFEESIARELSRHAAFLVHTLNLDQVYVSWPRAAGVSSVLSILKDEIRRHRSYDQDGLCSVEAVSMGALAPAYGAAGLHLESLFQTPDGPAPYFPGKS